MAGSAQSAAGYHLLKTTKIHLSTARYEAGQYAGRKAAGG
jgi:hypothetical protein